MRCYVVAASPRSGSSLLCHGLECTGVAGYPNEYFAPDYLDLWRHEWHLPDDVVFIDYARAVRHYATGPNGVAGVKVQWVQVELLSAWTGFADSCQALQSLFPGARYVNVVRRDRRAQALSWFRAYTTGEWWRWRDAKYQHDTEPPELDRALVLELEEFAEYQQRGWEQFFLASGIEVCVVEYERLAKDYRRVISGVLEFLGLPTATVADIPLPRLLKQADSVNAAWRAALDGEKPQILAF